MKHLVDVDDDALERAKRRLGTPTIKATVNTALRMASTNGFPVDEDPVDEDLDAALTILASVEFDDRSAAWR